MSRRRVWMLSCIGVCALLLSACEGVEMGVSRIDVRQNIQLRSDDGGLVELSEARIARDGISRIYLDNDAHGGGGRLSFRLGLSNVVFWAGDRFVSGEKGRGSVERWVPAAATGQGVGLRIRHTVSQPVDERGEYQVTCTRTEFRDECKGTGPDRVCQQSTVAYPGSQTVKYRRLGSLENYSVDLVGERASETVDVAEIHAYYDNVKISEFRSSCR